MVVDICSSDLMAINADVPQGSVQQGVVGYADDSTASERYFSRARASRDETIALRETMVERMNLTLNLVSQWGGDNLVKFNASKTQACPVSVKRSKFQCASVTNRLELLGMELSPDLNFGSTHYLPRPGEGL